MASIEQIKQLVKNRLVAKVIGLSSHEPALLDDSMQILRESVLKTDKGNLNHHRHVAGSIDLYELLATLQTPPFLASERLVELHNAEKIDAEALSKIIEYIENPAHFSVFIMVFNKVDKRNKIIAALDKHKQFFELASDEKDFAEYTRREAQSYGMTIDQELIQFLLLVLDRDLLAIKNVINKLSLCFEGKKLSLDEAEPHIVGVGMQDVFKLARSISEGDIKTSLKTLMLIRQSQENALKFLGVLMWQFRVFVHIRDCLDRKMAEWDIRAQVSVYGDRFNWMLKVAKKRTISFHINRLTKLLQCDVALKTQKIADPFNLIERVVYQITRSPNS